MKKPTIEFVKQYAIDHNGECLESEYKNNNTKMLWRCNKDGYEWEAIWSNIYNGGQWCPKCSSGKAQKQLHSIICQIYPDNIVEYDCHPEWLVNPNTGHRLEIDIFLPELNIAI